MVKYFCGTSDECNKHKGTHGSGDTKELDWTKVARSTEIAKIHVVKEFFVIGLLGKNPKNRRKSQKKGGKIKKGKKFRTIFLLNCYILFCSSFLGGSGILYKICPSKLFLIILGN